jgi:hypothetical protein
MRRPGRGRRDEGVHARVLWLPAAVAAVHDDAVIDVDRVRRRLDQRRGGGRRVSAAAVVLEGATEVSSSVTPALGLFLMSKVRRDAQPYPPLRSSRDSSRGIFPTALPPLLARSPQTARIEGGLGE